MAWVSKRLKTHKIVWVSVWAPLGRCPCCFGWTTMAPVRFLLLGRCGALMNGETTCTAAAPCSQSCLHHKPFQWRKGKSMRERQKKMCQSALLIPRPAAGLSGSRAFHTTSVFVASAHADLVGYVWTGNRLPGTSISPPTHIYIKNPPKCP